MMVLSRKANDQNRTILVIYSNHPPTNFGIITYTRGPNIVEPILTSVAPHSTAIG